METTIIANKEGYTSHAWKGNNYNSNLPLKDIAKIVKNQLKKEFPSCVFSIVCQLYSGGQSLHISLMSAPFEVYNLEYTQDKNGNVYNEKDFQHTQLNQYFLKEEDGYCNGIYLTKQCQEIFQRVMCIVNSFNFDDSDGMIDYFHTNFYTHLNIGKWDKPFVKL